MPGPAHTVDLEAAPGAWRYTSAPPDAALAGQVVEYWEVEGTLRPFRETLLPNGAVEVMVSLGPPHTVLAGAGAGEWDRGWYSGLQERGIEIDSRQGTHLVAARLHPLGAAALLGAAAPRAANGIVALDAVLGRDDDALLAEVAAASSPAERFAVLEALLLARLPVATPVPEPVRRAVAHIEAAHGRLRIAALHEALGISRKHLAVSFRRHVGVSAKGYAGIQRFVWTMARLQARSSVDWSQLAMEAGYSDQSHLVRDFRRVGAASPTEYLRRRSPDGAALLDGASG